jgi:hypothetical protein
MDFHGVKTWLEAFDFQKVFIEELGWSNPSRVRPAIFTAAGVEVTRRAIAKLGGFVVFEIMTTDGAIPDRKVREAAHKVTGGHQDEHVLIFVDRIRQQSVWSWVLRKDGRDHSRTHHYFRGQPGGLFISRLDSLMSDLSDSDAEGNVAVVKAARRVHSALDITRVTKKLYTDFQRQHHTFRSLVQGIPDEPQRNWYVSVLFNRLVFTYFLQKKGFLDHGTLDYLQERLAWSRAEVGKNRYYEHFLKPLFFEGFAKAEEHRAKATRTHLRHIPYLDSSLFLPHRIEQENRRIAVPDLAFEGLFAFFESYTWHLNDAPSGDDNEINLDVLGCLFEMYIGHKAIDSRRITGTYPAPAEIPEWLCEQTIHNLVLDRVNLPEGADLAVSDGPLARFDDISDLLLHLTPALCRRLLTSILPSLSLLDPVCRSGSFLVAALKTMHGLSGAVVGAAKALPDEELKALVAGWERDHPSLDYFLKKQIITRNLHGLDSMEEATEIARLRLLLALMASASPEDQLEPLPSIDTNVMPGNMLVDFGEGTRSKSGFDAIFGNLHRSTLAHEHQTTGAPRPTYQDFVERCYWLLRDKGQFGLILPEGIYKYESSKALRHMLFEKCALRALYSFSRDRHIFGSEASSTCLLVGQKGGPTRHFFAAFPSLPSRIATRSHLGEFLRDPLEHIELTSDIIRKTSPQSRTVLEFRSAADVPIAKKVLHPPLLGDELAGGWTVDFHVGLQIATEREKNAMRPQKGLRPGPVYAGNMLHQYEFHVDEPRLLLGKETRLRREPRINFSSSAYMFGFRNIAKSRDERTLIAAMIPPGVMVNDSVTIHALHPDELNNSGQSYPDALETLYILAAFNSYVLDWIIRMRISRHINMSDIWQLPLPRLTKADPRLAPIALRAARLTCTTPAFDGLARAAGFENHTRGVTHPEQRARLRAEIDGLVAHLYGLTEHEFAHILLTFPVVPDPVRESARNAYRAVARGDVI